MVFLSEAIKASTKADQQSSVLTLIQGRQFLQKLFFSINAQLPTMHHSQVYRCCILTLGVLTVDVDVGTFQKLDHQFHVAIVSRCMKSGVARI